MSTQLKNFFTSGRVNTDNDVRLVKPDEVIYADNIDFLQNGNNGVANSIKGNSIISGGFLNYGNDYYIGHCIWKEKVYLFYSYEDGAGDSGNYIIEYNSLGSTYVLVVKGDLNIPFDVLSKFLPRDFDRYVLSADVVDGIYLTWTGGLKQYGFFVKNGDLDPYKAPMRLHIADAKANPTTYSNFSGDLDKPNKVSVIGAYDPAIKNNQLKYGSYVFYTRYVNKYNEKTVLSYPSNCVNISQASEKDIEQNFINILGFTVDDDITSVEFFVSNRSDNTFTKIKDVDTNTSKDVASFTYYNKTEGEILDANSSNIINYEFPITATEQEIVDNRIIYADIDIYRDFKDVNGDVIDRSTTFDYTTAGSTATSQRILRAISTPVAAPNNLIQVDVSFVQDVEYTFRLRGSVDGYAPLLSFSDTTASSVIYSFKWTLLAGVSAAAARAELSELFSIQDSTYSVVAYTGGGVGSNSFDLAFTNGAASTIVNALMIEANSNSEGLNSRFDYKAGVVFLDDKGRHAGVSNVTSIKHDSDDLTFQTYLNFYGSSQQLLVTPPSWATKYMIVRDKVNTNLSYSLVSASQAATQKTAPTADPDVVPVNEYVGTHVYHRVDTQLYTNYISNYRGKDITVWSEALRKEITVRVMSNTDREAEADLLPATSPFGSTNPFFQDQIDQAFDAKFPNPSNDTENFDYIYVRDDLVIPEGTLILFRPNKEVDSKNEVFYETSNIFNISTDINGDYTFAGDGKILDWYDTKVSSLYEWVGGNTYGSTINNIPYVIMKTDDVSLDDINHLGRGAYAVSNEVKMDESASLVYSQKYDSSINYNGLNAFSSLYGNYLDLNKKYGRIVKLIEKDTYLLIAQRKKWSRIPINKSVITSAGGEDALTASNIFLDKRALNVYGADFGLTDKKSHASWGFADYGVDQDNGVILRLSRDGITVINGSRDYEIKTMLKGLNRLDFIVGGFNPDEEAYYVAFTDDNRVFKFSEVNKSQVGEIGYGAVLDFITVRNKFYSVSSVSEIYLNSSGTDNELYGSSVTNTLKYVVNHEPNVIKDLIAISLESNIACDVTIETDDNTTTIAAEDFEKKEDVWYADIPKDSTGYADYGIGRVITFVSGGTDYITFTNAQNVRIGDELRVGAVSIGTIESIEKTDGKITKTIIAGYTSASVSTGDLIYGRRPSKIEGKSMKGQYAVVTLTNDTGNPLEIFSAQMTVNVSSNQ